MHRDINFFAVYSSPLDNKSNGINPVTLIGTITVSACIILVLSLFGALKMSDLRQTLKINDINNYLNSAGVASTQNTVSSVTNKINAFNNYKDAVSGAYNAFQTLPMPDSKLIDSISKAMPGDVIVENITYTMSVISLQCISANQQSPEIFVHALKISGGFDNIIYNGFTLTDINNYTFNVTCTAKEAASKWH